MQIIKQKTNTRLMVYSKAQKKRLISGKMNSGCEDCIKNILTLRTACLAVVETSFFRPKNVGFFNSKLGRAADANRTINGL